MSKPDDIVSIALAEVGYKEKASNSALDDKTANAGPNNWTKYARDLAAVGYYNGNKNGFAWCDVFVDWCFFKAYGTTEGQRIQCQSGPLGAGCLYSAQYYKQMGRYDRIPRIGDQIFFQIGGELVHTGLVVGVTDNTIITVEGNSGDQVKKNTYSRSNAYIDGYGHPLYSEEENASTPVQTAEDGACDIRLPLLRNGNTGREVRNAQALLILKGYPCGGRIVSGREVPDGEFGPTTERSVRSFQNQHKLQSDGIIGAETWKALLTS